MFRCACAERNRSLDLSEAVENLKQYICFTLLHMSARLPSDISIMPLPPWELLEPKIYTLQRRKRFTKLLYSTVYHKGVLLVLVYTTVCCRGVLSGLVYITVCYRVVLSWVVYTTVFYRGVLSGLVLQQFNSGQ